MAHGGLIGYLFQRVEELCGQGFSCSGTAKINGDVFFDFDKLKINTRAVEWRLLLKQLDLGISNRNKTNHFFIMGNELKKKPHCAVEKKLVVGYKIGVI